MIYKTHFSINGSNTFSFFFTPDHRICQIIHRKGNTVSWRSKVKSPVWYMIHLMLIGFNHNMRCCVIKLKPTARMASLLPPNDFDGTRLWKVQNVLHNCSSVRLWFNQIIRRAGDRHTNSPPKSSAAVRQLAMLSHKHVGLMFFTYSPPPPSVYSEIFLLCSSPSARIPPTSIRVPFARDLLFVPSVSCFSFCLFPAELFLFVFFLCRHLSWECSRSTTRTSSHLW